MGKASLWRVPVSHFSTLYDARTGKPDWRAWASQVGIPFAGGVVAYLMNARLVDVGDVVAGVSIVSGLLFSMSVFLFQLRMTFARDSRLTEFDYRLVDECMANTLWAIVWGLVFTLYLIVAGAGNWIGDRRSGPIFTGIAVAAALHFLAVIMMCIKRLRRAYERIAMRNL
ncbi:hypothetical protein D4740_07320 [Actinomyces sp. 2119]|uniref:hypothetical protein n=1 Tax=Actinomyces sp. 2119 TaxID=2321393 RepID=UPI000E6BB25A|nr:hypothetical protein [Actinomyces sp. 2119]RJF41882.1 hypothetical protein D4740_07320 [Actinomyces sp. 2119]